MSIDTRSIRSEPHAEIGALIQRDAALLTERWCRRAVEEQATAKRVHHDVLRDHLAPFLEAMGRALRQTGEAEPQQHVRPAWQHGDQRWESGWSLSEVVRDFQILRLVVLEHLENSLSRALRYREIMAVGVFVDDAIAASISTYVSNRDEHVRQVAAERTDDGAERKRDEFMAMLAHELRNPLAPIENASRVLRISLPDPPRIVEESLDVVERQTRQLVRLVDELHDLARIGQGSFALKRTIVGIRAILDRAVEASTTHTDARGQMLSLALPDAAIHVDADGERLATVFAVLMHDAAKHALDGGHVRVAAERDGNEVVVRVQDDGIGVAPEARERAFDLDAIAAADGHSSPSGSGVGMALARRLVEMHGGSVACTSSGRGRGSELVVRLPAPEDLAPASDDRPPRERPAVAPCSLVIVEDYADARETLATLLRLLGHTVDVAENGTRGVERVLAKLPDVALVDIGLPDIDGYEVARRIRASAGERVCLVALTGHGRPEDHARAREAGFDAHLVKPTDVGEIERLLVKRCSGRDRKAEP